MRPRSPGTAPTLVQLLLMGLALSGFEVAVLYSGVPAPPPWQVLLFPVGACFYMAAGAAAWLRRPSNRIGALLVWGGVALIGSGLTTVITIPALRAVGLVVATIPFAVLVHLLHAFPSGRLSSRLSLWTVISAYVVCTVPQAPLYLWSPGPLEIGNRPDLVQIFHWVQHGAGLLVMIVTAWVLARRLTGMSSPQRWVVGPLYAYGISVVLWLPAAADLHELSSWSPLLVLEVQVISLAVLPVALVLAMLRGGFRRTGELQELGAWLSAEDTGEVSLEGALNEVVGDPSLTLAFWFADSGVYVDADGRARELPEPSSGRASVEVVSRGQRVAAITYDATVTDPAVVRAAGRVVALALEREQLTAALRASSERLRVSRARIVDAADIERRRIARDLHDGLQSRLIILGIKAHVLRARGVHRAPREAAELHTGLQGAITELRGLVEGLMPAMLAERGLYAAVEELAESIPLPVRLELDRTRGRLPASAESAAYFFVSEAITNALKHSQARELHLRIASDRDRLLVEVADDGVGGIGPDSGTGLRGIADRVEAVGGRIRFHSPPGGGTRVTAEVPCG